MGQFIIDVYSKLIFEEGILDWKGGCLYGEMGNESCLMKLFNLLKKYEFLIIIFTEP